MDRITKLYLAFAATTLAVALVFAATPAAAQSCGACDNIEDNDGNVDGHWAVAWWNSSGPADTPNDYHFGIEGGSCSAHHDWCESGGMQLAEAVIEAVKDENVTYLSEVVTRSSAVIVEDRQAIQIPNCDGTLIMAHLPVSEDLMAGLQAALADLADSQ